MKRLAVVAILLAAAAAAWLARRAEPGSVVAAEAARLTGCRP